MKVGKEGEGYFIEKVLKLNESDIEEDTPTDSYFRHFAAQNLQQSQIIQTKEENNEIIGKEEVLDE